VLRVLINHLGVDARKAPERKVPFLHDRVQQAKLSMASSQPVAVTWCLSQGALLVPNLTYNTLHI